MNPQPGRRSLTLSATCHLRRTRCRHAERRLGRISPLPIRAGALGSSPGRLKARRRASAGTGTTKKRGAPTASGRHRFAREDQMQIGIGFSAGVLADRRSDMPGRGAGDGRFHGGEGRRSDTRAGAKAKDLADVPKDLPSIPGMTGTLAISATLSGIGSRIPSPGRSASTNPTWACLARQYSSRSFAT